MIITEVLNRVADWALLSSFPAVFLFAAYYSRSRWRSTAVGRSLMYQSLSMALVLVVVLSSMLWHDYPGRPIVRLVGYTWLSVNLWRMFFTLRAYQKTADEQDPRLLDAFLVRKRTQTPPSN